MQIVLFLIIGLLAGIAGGFFGIGGAIITIPLLVFAAHFPQHLAQGTSLGALTLPIVFLAAWRYHQEGNVNLLASGVIALGFFFGGWIGANFAHQLDGATLRRIFGIMTIGIGLKLVLGK